MEVTEKNENWVISSKTQKWKVILETKISDQLKKQSLNFTSKIYCLGVVLEFTVLCSVIFQLRSIDPLLRHDLFYQFFYMNPENFSTKFAI